MRLSLPAAIFCAVFFTVAAHAIPITYTESAIASGTFLGKDNFQNALVTFTVFSDTSNNVTVDAGSTYITQGNGTVSVAGLGSFLVTYGLEVFSNTREGIAGVSGTSPFGGTPLDTSSSAFQTYELGSAIGPISGPGGFTPSFLPTNGGELLITGIGGTGDSTFTATTSVAATPEPSSIALFSTGILLLAGTARLRLLDRRAT